MPKNIVRVCFTYLVVDSDTNSTQLPAFTNHLSTMKCLASSISNPTPQFSSIIPYYQYLQNIPKTNWNNRFMCVYIYNHHFNTTSSHQIPSPFNIIQHHFPIIFQQQSNNILLMLTCIYIYIHIHINNTNIIYILTIKWPFWFRSPVGTNKGCFSKPLRWWTQLRNQFGFSTVESQDNWSWT